MKVGFYVRVAATGTLFGPFPDIDVANLKANATTAYTGSDTYVFHVERPPVRFFREVVTVVKSEEIR